MRNMSLFYSNQYEWAAQTKETFSASKWSQWCSKINLAPKRISDLPTPGKFKHRKSSEAIKVAMGILEGRKLTKDDLWEIEHAPAICPCLRSKAQEPTNPCQNANNTVGRKQTHNPTIWKKIIEKHHDYELGQHHKSRSTFLRHYCLCGEHFPSNVKRDNHSLRARDGHQHGAFFDDVTQAGGAFILLDRKQLKVIDAGTFRLRIPTTKPADSTWAEAATLALAHSMITPNTAPDDSPGFLPTGASIHTLTDSNATIMMRDKLVLRTPTMTEEKRSNLGSIAATMRNIMSSALAAHHTHTISHVKAEHDLPFNSEEHLDLNRQMNKAVDAGAEEGRTYHPGEHQDFGSSADARADPPIPGTGFPISWTRNGLNAPPSLKDEASAFLAAQSLHHLTLGGTIGTVPRLVTTGTAASQLNERLQSTLSPSVENMINRIKYGRSSASVYEVAHKLDSSDTEVFYHALSACGPKLAKACILCNEKMKDSYAHHTQCTHPSTQRGLQSLDLLTNEAITRTGPCELPQRRGPPPSPGTALRNTPKNTIRAALRRIIVEPANMGAARDLAALQHTNPEYSNTLKRFHERRNHHHGHIPYRHAQSRGDGRLFAQAGSMQLLKSSIRASVGNRLYDLDFDCSHPSIIVDVCRALHITVPPSLREVVINREEMRRELSNHYLGVVTTQGIKLGKSLVNAILYGQKPTSKTCFKEANIPYKSPPENLVNFSRVMYTLVEQIVSEEYFKAAKARSQSKRKQKTDQQLRFSALSDLAARIEQEKLNCVLQRLTEFWGIPTDTAILMHDGAMVDMSHLHPDGEAVKRDKQSIDREILQDLTHHTRRTMNVYIRLSVKEGKTATDVTCGVPWPMEDLSQEQAPNEHPEGTIKLLGPPKITLSRTQKQHL